MLVPLKSVRSPQEQRTFKFPIITTILIVANVAAFMFQLLHGVGKVSATYGAIPYELTRFRDLPPLSEYPVHLSLIISLFLHGGFMHIIGNMLYLNAFGPNVENKMGHFRFLLFYLICGVGATLSYTVPNFSSHIPLIGASGAIAGVMGAHFVAFPGSKIKCFLFPFFFFRFALPAIVVLIPWIFIQVMNIYRIQSNVAWIAHIGGFILGMFLDSKFTKKKRREWNVENYH